MGNKQFLAILADLKESMVSDPMMSDFKRSSVLHSLLQMRVRDEELIDLACQSMMQSSKKGGLNA